MAKQNSTTTGAAAVSILSGPPKDQQTIIWDYMMDCGVEPPKSSLSADGVEAVCNVSCTAMNAEEILMTLMDLSPGERTEQSDAAHIEAVILLVQKMGWLADHIAKPQKGDVRGDVYRWMHVPKGEARPPMR